MVDPVLMLVLESVLITAASFLVGESLIRLITTAAGRNGVSTATLRTVREGITAIWIAVAAVGVTHLTGIMEEFTTLTISGIAGIAITLALQTTLSNILSGVFLLRDNILRLGDMIECGGVKGQVIKVALRDTWVKTDEGKIAVFGNSLLAGGPLINHSAATRFSEILGPSG